MKKIILICTRSITFNTFLKSQAEYFNKKGFKIEIACSDNNKLDFKSNLTYKIDFPNKIIELFNLVKYVKIYFQIRHLVKKNPTALYYLHTPLASHFFRLLTFFKKLKIIYFVHGFRFTSRTNHIKGFIFKYIEKILSFNTSIFITINNEDFNYANLNLVKKSLCYQVKGVGLELSKNHFLKKILYKNRIKKILVIAAYKKEKGYLDIIKVAELLKNKNIQIECYGYGDYNKFNSIKIKKKLSNILFKNFDYNLKNKIKKYDLLLHLSKREGLPVAVMQSLTNGLPVICYKIRGNNDLIKHNFNGYFVESYKDVVNKIYYLQLENKVFNNMRLNAFKSINKSYLKKKINIKIYKIINSNF